MTFTDDELKRLKAETVDDHTHDGPFLSAERMLALLARLDAAEKFITESRCQNGCYCDNECEKHLPLEKAWRKACGR